MVPTIEGDNYCELYSKHYREFCYGTSWSLLNESDAMWRIDSSDAMERYCSGVTKLPDVRRECSTMEK
jgi:hypothetical protein